MIAIVWLLSGLISIPPLLGWKKDTPPGEFPKCVVSLLLLLYSKHHNIKLNSTQYLRARKDEASLPSDGNPTPHILLASPEY